MRIVSWRHLWRLIFSPVSNYSQQLLPILEHFPIRIHTRNHLFLNSIGSIFALGMELAKSVL